MFAPQVGGPGKVTTGGGFIGGGLGVKGSAEGMLIAEVLNRLTSRTHARTLVEIQTADVAVVLVSDQLTIDQVQEALRPAYWRLRTAQSASLQVPASDERTDVVGALERLAKLHQSGLLTDDEFRQAKALALDDHQ